MEFGNAPKSQAGTVMLPQPAQVHVIWHREDVQGSIAAEQLYRTLTRNFYDAWGLPLGIPVMQHPVDARVKQLDSPDPSIPVHIHLILLSEPLLCSWEAGYGKEIEELNHQWNAPSSGRIVQAVGLAGAHIRWPDTETQVRTYHPDGRTDGSKVANLELYVLQLLSMALMVQPEEDDPRIRIYLSHEDQKSDLQLQGILEDLRSNLQDNRVFENFVELHDWTGNMNPFSRDPKMMIDKSVVVVILTDGYSSAQRCREEIRHAKANCRPIVVVEALEHGCERLFPLLGNVPVIHWDPSRHLAAQVLRTALQQHLRYTRHLRINQSLLHHCPEGTIPLPDHPERLQLVQRLPKRPFAKQYFLVPDPPIAPPDTLPLLDLGPDSEFLTPNMLLAREQFTNAFLSATALPPFAVAISISEVDASSIEYLRSNNALRDAMVEFTRYLFHENCTIHYGGNPGHKPRNPDGKNAFNFVHILQDLVQAYDLTQGEGDKPVTIYLAEPLYDQLSAEKIDEDSQFAQLLRVPMPEKGSAEGITASDHLEAVAVEWQMPRALTHMRNFMHQHVQLRIVMGGRLQGYQGRMPGIVEEAYLAIQAGIPLFVIGGFGGCARVIAEAMEGGNPPELSTEWHAQHNPEVTAMLLASPSMEDIAFSYEEVTATFQRHGQQPNNGLNAAENEVLLHTRSVDEALRCILKGIRRLRAR